MKPHHLLASFVAPDGGLMSLHGHDGSFAIRHNGRELMHSLATASETLLGELGAAALPPRRPARVLIGGLGLGFTLRAVLQNAPANTQVEVAELFPALVSWHQTHLHALHGACLDDPRVTTHLGDVAALLQTAPAAHYDAILLDIDNGPVAMVAAGNRHLYDEPGLRRLHRLLRPGGRLVVWSAGPDPAFARRLTRTGFQVDLVPAKTHPRARRPAYLLFVADKPSPA